MLRLVTAAFNDEGIAVIEAGTGTGKSLAYLVPALHWARANGEKVVVSTNTINLQEQLIAKDLPFLQKHLGVEFTAVLMKGRNNYLCRRKASFVAATPDFFADERIVGQLQALLEWARQTKNGSLSDLNFLPDDEVWEQLSCDADNCTRVRCMHYADCFFYQARRQAAAADLIVANHHLVMADLAVRLESNNQTTAAVLPPYRRIIFDEAHNIEDVATQYFGLRITRRTLSRLLHRLIHRERPGQGLLPFVHGRLVMLAYELGTPALNDAVALIENELMPLRGELAVSLGSLLDLCARGVLDMTGERLAPRREVQLRITDVVTESHFWQQDLRRALGEATDRMARLVAGLRKVDEAIGKLPDKPRESFQDPAGELRSIGNRLAARLNDLRSFYTVGENQCRWIEVRQPPGSGSPSVQLVSLPLDVRAPLNAAIYNHAKTVVMTSATLTVDRRFDFFLDQVGLASEHAEPDTRRRIATLQLDTPFDFDRQAFVGVPIDLPDPLDRLFDEAATALLLPMLQASGGSAFVLFTSYRQLNGFYDRLARPLESMGYTCLRQGDENRQNLLKRFQADRSSILFATSSFWEGVDVPGDALRMLVLVKLPFRVPSDPLMQARVERIQAQGLDAFTEYALPHAVIRFKQGFGRLIRTRDDYGAVLLLDRRLVTKPYGRVFLNSLPARTIHRKPAQHLLEDLTTFFEERR
jgi:ATP-dependent DNA helicase DinG